MNEQVNPRSVLRLVAWQGRGRLRRMGRRFLLPRRMVLSLLAFLLAAAWLGNAAMTVWLRESASPELLQAMVGLGLAFYAIWHLAMAACFRPQQCLEWIAAERDILEACPLRPRDLLIYKLASVATPTLLKSMVLILLLLPDLGNVPIALAGILLGMLFPGTLANGRGNFSLGDEPAWLSGLSNRGGGRVFAHSVAELQQSWPTARSPKAKCVLEQV